MFGLFREKKRKTNKKKSPTLSPSKVKKYEDEIVKKIEKKLSKKKELSSSQKNKTVKSMLPTIRRLAEEDQKKERLEKEHKALTLRLKKLDNTLTSRENKLLIELSMPSAPKGPIYIGKTKKGGKKKRRQKRNGKTKKYN